MRKIFIALTIATLTAGPAMATEETDVMVPVYQFIDGFNKNDTKTAIAACADQTSIIDEFPPHEWRGAGACSNWARAYDTDTKKNESLTGSLSCTSHAASTSREIVPMPSFRRITPSRKRKR
jgi:hypothetical protein